MHVLINNSKSTGPTKILEPFLSFSDNLLQENHIIFQKIIDDFEIVLKCVQFWFGMQFPLKVSALTLSDKITSFILMNFISLSVEKYNGTAPVASGGAKDDPFGHLDGKSEQCYTRI